MAYDNQVFEVSGTLGTCLPLKAAIEYAAIVLGITSLDGAIPAIQLDHMGFRTNNATFRPVYLGLIPKDYDGKDWIRWEDFFHAPCHNAETAAKAIRAMFMERFDLRKNDVLDEVYGPGIYDRGFMLNIISHSGIAESENAQAPKCLRIEDMEYALLKVRPTWMFKRQGMKEARSYEQ